MGSSEQIRASESFLDNTIVNAGRRSLFVTGTSFKSSPIDYRESLLAAIDEEDLWAEGSPLEEATLVSTCNRYELYYVSRNGKAAQEWVLDVIRRSSGLEVDGGRFYTFEGESAVRHLFRVATGLESVVIGEPQILSQVRAAGISSRKRGKAKGILAPLFDRANRVGSRVRTSQGLKSGEASLSDLAVEISLKELEGRVDVLLIGTGKMIRLAALSLRGRTNRVYVATRRKKAVREPEGWTRVSYQKIRALAPLCDLVISATTTAEPLLREEDLAGGGRKVVVDLGMPRNVEPSVRGLPNVRLFDLDDLARVPQNRVVAGAESEVDKEAAEFHDWLIQTRLSSTLADLYGWAESVRTEELRRALRKMDLSRRDRKVVEAMGRRIVSKLMSKPAKFARTRRKEISEEEKLELLDAVFEAGLNE